MKKISIIIMSLILIACTFCFFACDTPEKGHEHTFSEWQTDKDYHYNKFKLCKENNITLVSIFESEWNSRRDEIFNYLKDLFSGIENKLSYNEDSSLMNNNYPLPRFKLNIYVLENYYTLNDTKVFTCGYSKIDSTCK